MSFATQAKETMFFLSSGFGIEPTVHAKAGGGKIFSGVPVFRSGSFADSRGIRNTWEDLHIRQMVDNLSHLAKKKIIESVPARDGHPEFLVHGMRGKGEVVGYHLDVKHEVMKSPVDGKEYTYLLADYEVTATFALEKIEKKLWRNRSAEIASYVTNDESEFWPVYLGFAFVDFGAVEGLNFSAAQGNRSYFVLGETLRENEVTDNALPVQPALMFGVPAATQTAPAAPAVQPAFVFSCNGQNVTDFNQVQAYIGRLEGFARETREAGRRDFVASLVKANKLGAPQQEGQTAFALSLTDEQYSAWKLQWETAPVSSVLAVHGSGSGNPAAAGTATDADAKITTAKEIVAMHRLNNMSDANLRGTDSFKVLVAAGIEK